MDTPFITWICIAIFSLVVIMIRGFEEFRRRGCTRRRHLIEFATESEELFIPGDPYDNDETCNDKE